GLEFRRVLFRSEAAPARFPRPRPARSAPRSRPVRSDAGTRPAGIRKTSFRIIRMKTAPRSSIPAAAAPAVPFGKALANLLRAMREQARVLRLSQVAGSLAFLSMIAIVPMFSIGFAVLTALPVFGQMRAALH